MADPDFREELKQLGFHRDKTMPSGAGDWWVLRLSASCSLMVHARVDFDNPGDWAIYGFFVVRDAGGEIVEERELFAGPPLCVGIGNKVDGLLRHFPGRHDD